MGTVTEFRKWFSETRGAVIVSDFLAMPQKAENGSPVLAFGVANNCM